MNRLDKNGYLLSVSGWMGNLGNHIIQISGAVNVAKNTQSRLTLPPHHMLRPRTFDFMEKGNDNCLEPISGSFFYQHDCFQYPIVYDQQRRRILQDYVYEDLQKKSLRESLRHTVRRETRETVAPDTLVINMRSGADIFRTEPPPQNDYMQPPLSFYKRVIESHGYKDCLIVTEQARKNPCIDALLSWNENVRIKKHESVRDDIQTLLSAKHLVTCHSTFSWLLALMSKNLRTLHQPSSFQIRGVSDFSVYTYTMNNYIKPGEWTSSPEQLSLMLNHSVEDIEVAHSPAAPQAENAEVDKSYLW